jgi:hypothetical protein
VLEGTDLALDPRVMALDEGGDLGIAHAGRRHHLDATRAHADAQAAGASAAPQTRGNALQADDPVVIRVARLRRRRRSALVVGVWRA